MTLEDYRSIESEIPFKPGVYQFIDEKEVIIYIGKAKSLKKRIASYFSRSYQYAKVRVMVSKAAKVIYTIVETEQDALLLENNLVKKHLPKYNIQLKDDKSYPFICIKKERFPRVFLTRKLIKDGSEYLGPYTSVRRVKIILDILKNIFPLRNCNYNLSEENISQSKFKICLEHHLGNCLGPCEALQNEEDYNKNLQQLRKILKGEFGAVITFLKEKMNVHSENFDFEKANDIKQKLNLLKQYTAKSTIVNPKIHNIDVFGIEANEEESRYYVNIFKISNGAIIQTKMVELKSKLDESKETVLAYAIDRLRSDINSTSEEVIVPFKVELTDENINQTIPQRGDKLSLLELAQKNVRYYRNQQTIKNSEYGRQAKGMEVLAQIKNDFKLLELPVHIECFDNSNFQGSYPTSSCVVFKNGKASKKDYRHYNIRSVDGPNDFASMEEVVYRRYKRLLEEDLPLPQLIVIDGGKGQLSSAKKSLDKLNIYGKVSIIGIAKKLEEIYVPGDSLPLLISKKSASLKVIQQLRNEAHRFAITLHRKNRSTGSLNSEFNDIEGIGSKSIEKLYKHFKSFDAIKKADKESLSKVLDKRKAEKIFEHFNG